MSQNDSKNKTKRSSSDDSLSVLIPVYNSEQTIGLLVDQLIDILSPSFKTLELILVNDGSQDNSHERILEAIGRHPGMICYVRLARNFGEHNAVMCGLNQATSDYIAIIDDDFQNPPSEILKLIQTLQDGYDVVYSYYEKKYHGFLRNLGSRFNDWVATRLLSKPKGLYLSSFKVFNRFVAQSIITYSGPFPYIDGLILRSTQSIGTQLCEHAARSAGRSNYNLRRLITLWLNMFTSFSVIPLRISTVTGFIVAGLGLFLSVFYAISWTIGGLLIDHEAFPPGWASLIISITIFSGVQLCLLGIVGEYIGRIFLTQNAQPQYVVREIIRSEGPKGDSHGA